MKMATMPLQAPGVMAKAARSCPGERTSVERSRLIRIVYTSTDPALAAKTWRKRDGRVKIHFSNQWPGGPAGAHSRSIHLGKFLRRTGIDYDAIKAWKIIKELIIDRL